MWLKQTLTHSLALKCRIIIQCNEHEDWLHPLPALSNGMLQEIMYVTGSIATTTACSHSYERKLEIYSTALYMQLFETCLTVCFVLETLYISAVFIARFIFPQNIGTISFKAQAWGLLCNCQKLRNVCNVPLCGLELCYRLQEEYIVMFICERDHYLSNLSLVCTVFLLTGCQGYHLICMVWFTEPEYPFCFKIICKWLKIMVKWLAFLCHIQEIQILSLNAGCSVWGFYDYH